MNNYQNLIFINNYSRWNYDLGRRETFEETVDRYFNFMLKKIPEEYHKSFLKTKKYLLNLDVVPSMRALWSAGPALDRCNVAGYNCSYLPIESVESFSELLYILASSAGVGFSVERQYINKLPTIADSINDSNLEIIVGDSKEGWATALNQLLHSLYNGNCPIKIDYSEIRPKGSVLKTFGGRASGYEPLKELFDYIINLFKNNTGKKLTSIQCNDICCYIAKVIIAGGVRRSATISLSNLSDNRMRYAKTPSELIINPHRYLANNSATYEDKPEELIFFDEWKNLMESGTGERGIFNRYAIKKLLPKTTPRRDIDFVPGANPCFSGDTLVKIYDEKTDTVFDKKIKDVVVGDTVLSFNIRTGKQEYKKCTMSKMTRPMANVIKSTIADSNGLFLAEIIHTPDHKFLTEDGDYKPLTLNSKVLGLFLEVSDNSEVYNRLKVGFVRKQESMPDEPVYDITVGNNHNFFANNVVAHNCNEIILRPYQFCNLTEVILRPDDNLNTIQNKIKAATIWGCVQSTLTDFKFLRPIWKETTEKERLLGVSLTGLRDHKILGNLNVHTRDKIIEWLKIMKQTAIDVAEEWSSRLGIKMPVAITTIKPSGNTSQLCGCSSGLHPAYSKYYIRRVRLSSLSPICKMLIDQGIPYEYEVGQDKDNHNTLVFSFPMKSSEYSVLKDDLNAIDQLEYWKILQLYWCEHKPSCTVYVGKGEWIQVASWVYKNWDIVSGIAFLPKDEHFYQLAPYEEISEEQYNELIKNQKEIDFSKLVDYEKEDYTDGAKTYACTGDKCELN